MMFPLVRDLADDRTWKIPVAVTCRVLGFSKQAYYAWRAAPVSQRDWDDAHLINAAVDIHHDGGVAAALEPHCPQVRLEPHPGRCCVVLRSNGAPGGSP